MEHYGLEDLRWPVMAFGNPRCCMARYDSASSALSPLSSASVRAIRRLNEYFFIDSTGTRYDLSSIEFIGRVSVFWRLASELFGISRPVRWSFSKIGTVTVDEFKKMIRDDVEEYSHGEDEHELEKLDVMLDKATTYDEVFRAIGGPLHND